MSVTIQINSVAALERLLQGEGDEQVSIKKAVLLEYERRHVLPVIEARVKAIVEAEVANQMGKSTWQGFQLKKEVADQVQKLAREEAKMLLSGEVRTAVNKVRNEAGIDQMVRERLETYINVELISQVRQGIMKKLGE